MNPTPHKTRRAWNEPGHAHFVTYSCAHRLPLLARDRTRRWVLDALERTRARLDAALWAYVIMPEHVHVLLCPLRANYEMRRILVALKRPVSDSGRDRRDPREPGPPGFGSMRDRLAVVERTILGGSAGSSPPHG